MADQRLAFRECIVDGEFRILTENPTNAQKEAMAADQSIAHMAGALNEIGIPAVTRSSIGVIQNVPHFDLTNGDIASARSLFVRPTIATCYHWCLIPNLPRAEVMAHSDLFIKMALAQLSVGGIPAHTDAQRRKQAIILGFSRAVITSYYGIQPDMLIPGEVADPMLVYQPASTEEPILPAIVHLAPNLPEGHRTILMSRFDPTEEEKEIMTVLLLCAISVPVLQGLSLVTVNHHYLSGNVEGSRKAFDVVERQFWSVSTHATWFISDMDIVRDVMWHKAGHPINVQTKMDWAMDASIKEMLVRAGAGSATARLPAEEPELRAANTYLTLCRTVEPMLAAYGGTFNFSPLQEALEYVRFFSTGAGVTTVAITPPPGITSRARAIAHLTGVLKLNEGLMAIAYGFYFAQTEREALTGLIEGPDTLAKAFSLKKLGRNSPGAYRSGMIAYEDYLSARTKSREEGRFIPLALDMYRLGGGAGEAGPAGGRRGQA